MRILVYICICMYACMYVYVYVYIYMYVYTRTEARLCNLEKVSWIFGFEVREGDKKLLQKRGLLPWLVPYTSPKP